MPEQPRATGAVSAVVLAAGESRRMGGRNKLRFTIAGEALLRRTMKSLLASDLDEIVVVLGHQADTIRPLLRGLNVNIVYNEHYAEGQMTSVYAGLSTLEGRSNGVMICLGDQPLLTTEDVNALIREFRNREGGSILVPVYRGRRGNPIILDIAHREEILRGNRNLGCKRLIEKNPHLVATVDMPTDHFVVDLDTPDDYRKLERRLLNQETVPA